MIQFYVFVSFLILALTATLIWRRTATKAVDWELVVAFIRRDFPPNQRDAAQEIAAGMVELVGFEIKQLRPDHTLDQIAGWAHHYLFSVRAEDFATLFSVEYGVASTATPRFELLWRRLLRIKRSAPNPRLKTDSRTLASKARSFATA